MTSTTRMAVSVLAGLVLSAGAALAGGAPKQADIDACNKEAAAIKAGKAPSTAPGSATPGSGPSGGQSSVQNRPLDSTTGQPQGTRKDDMKKDTQGGMMKKDAPAGDLMKGMAPAGETDPAYRATYMECLKKRGYTS
jgi:hypothetical protein